MTDAREEILGRIRRIVENPARQAAAEEYSRISGSYNHSGSLDPEARNNLFVERLRDYDADVYFSSESRVAEVIGQALTEHGKQNLLVAEDIPAPWLPTDFRFDRDTGLAYEEIQNYDGILTSCALAIAATGTILLAHSPASAGRRALTLLPDYHLCVVFAQQIIETVPEAIQLAAKLDPAVPLTTVSGPSATADIEMTRIRGVHGPRTLNVVLVTQL